MESLKWILELVDQVSGPARNVGKSLKSIETAATGVSKSVGPRLIQNMSSAISGFGKLGSTIVGTGAKIASYAALATVAAGAWGAKKLGEEALRASAYKENALISLEVMLKSRQKAAETYKEAEAFAAKTPFNTQEVIGLYQQLITAGFSIEKNAKGISEVSELATAIGDAAAAQGMSPEAIKAITKQIGQTKSVGKLRNEELSILSEWGIGRTNVVDVLMKDLGKTRAETEKLLSAGKIDATTGIKAITSTIQSTTGGMMARQAETMTGLWSTLTSRPFEILSKLGEHGELEPLKAAIKFLGDELAPEGALAIGIGKFVSAMFTEIPKALKVAWALLEPFVDVLGMLWDALVDIYTQVTASKAAMEGLSIVLGAVYLFFLGVWGILGAIVYVFAKVVQAVLYAIGVFSILFQKIGASAVEFYNGAIKLGSAIIDGIVNGITNGATAIKDAAVGAVDSAYQGVTEFLGIASPSKLYMDVGKNSALGIAKGFSVGAANIGRAAMGVIPGPDVFSPSTTGSSLAAQSTTANNQITINVNVNGQAEPAEIQRSVLAALSEAFEGIGWEMGVAPQ